MLSGRRDVEWYGAGSLTYSVQGGRDVLIIESDLPISNPEVVPRRSSELTDEDRQKLKSQGVFSDDLDEVSIVKGRYKCDKRRTLFRVIKSESNNPLSLDKVHRSITELFECTKNDGGIYMYNVLHGYYYYMCTYCWRSRYPQQTSTSYIKYNGNIIHELARFD